MVLDPVRDIIGDFGRWQCLQCLPQALSSMIFIQQVLVNKFFTYSQSFQCSQMNNHDNQTTMLDHCSLAECGTVLHDSVYFQNTIVERFDLVCELSFVPKLAQSLFFAGTLVGASMSGFVADRFGRIKVYLISMHILGLSGLAGYFSPNMYFWIAFRFSAGAAVMAMNLSANVYRTEIVSGKWASLVPSIAGGMAAQLGHIILGLLVYFIPDMKLLELGMALVTGVYILGWWFIPESPRWLIVRGRTDEASQILQRIAKINGTLANDANGCETKQWEALLCQMEHIQAQKQAHPQISTLVTFPGIRRNFLAMNVVWICYNISYYGLIYNTPALDWSIYWVFVFPAFLTIPALFVTPQLEIRFGRKSVMFVALVISSCLALGAVAIPKQTVQWVIIALCVSATVCTFCALQVGYTYSKELYPTALRSTGLGVNSSCARIGAILAPVLALLDRFGSNWPLVAYGAANLVGAAFLVWVWPEMSGRKLPETAEECEELAQETNPWRPMNWRKTSKETAKG